MLRFLASKDCGCSPPLIAAPTLPTPPSSSSTATPPRPRVTNPPGGHTSDAPGPPPPLRIASPRRPVLPESSRSASTTSLLAGRPRSTPPPAHRGGGRSHGADGARAAGGDGGAVAAGERAAGGFGAERGEHAGHGRRPRLLRQPRLRDRGLHPPRPGEDAGHHDGAREHRQDHRERRGHSRTVRHRPPVRHQIPQQNGTNMQNGTVHPFTLEVIKYVKSLLDYQSTLKILFQQSETGSETESQLAVVIMKIMQALQNNLNGKSKQYKDPALSHIFLMNNLHYMVTSVRRSQAKDILGDDWIQRHGKIVQQNANQYKRVAWARILQTLTIQATGGTGSSAPSDVSSSGVSRSMIKERFKSFNAQFEELHAVQSQWTIPDQELRDNLRLAVAEVFLPAYRSFINRFGNLVQREKNPHKHIKHSPEALEQLLGQFFQGQQVGEQKH